jgi:glycosyltransferase involved in cell wall biosynthesis
MSSGTGMVFIDPRGVISRSRDSLNRHVNYAKKLAEEISGTEYKPVNVYLFTALNSDLRDKPENGDLSIQVFGNAKRFSFGYLTRSVKILKKAEFSRTLLIVGDPWESLLHALIVKRLVNQEIVIQTNIHADVFDIKWINQKITNRFRSKLAWYSIKRSDSIRVVSENMLAVIQERYPNKSVAYAPIATSISGQVTSSQNFQYAHPLTLGWVGRLEKDRGILEFINFVRTLNEKNQEFQVVMAGSGHLLDHVLDELNSVLGETRFTYLGLLPQEELGKVFEQMDILISFAESESYGLAIREALLFGKPVLGVKSGGISRLQAIVGSKHVGYLKNFDDISIVESAIQKLLASEIQVETIRKLKEQDKTYLATLIQSWLALLFPKFQGGH